MDIKPDYIFKIILVGDSSSGKSSFFNRFTKEEFHDNPGSTIGVDFRTKLVKLSNDEIVKFQIWDTAGQENFYSICRTYYKHNSAAFILYDVTNRKTFDNVNIWIERLRENNENFSLGGSSTIYLLGNKIDLSENRKVSYEEGMLFASKHNILFSEISCKSNNNIHNVGERMANKLYDNVKSGKLSLTEVSSGARHYNQSMYIRLHEKESKSGCC